MKILQVLTGEMGYDGISAVVMNIAVHMRNSGVTIDIIAQNNANIEVVEKFRSIGCDVKVLTNRVKCPARYYKKFKKIISESQYDIIHIHCNSATVALEIKAIIKGSDSKIFIHSHNTTCKYKIVDRLFRKYMYKNATQLIACGREAGKWLFEDRKYIVVNNGIDISKYAFDEFKRKKIRKELCIDECEAVIGHIGKFNQQKNHKYLIEVFNNLLMNSQKYKLLLIGKGELLDVIKEKVKKFGISDKVIFLGETDNVGDMLNAMDIIVFPSIYEGVPLTLIEAQANGLPCVVSDKISAEVKVTELVSFYSLENKDEWCKAVKDTVRMDDRIKYAMRIKEEGYDLENSMRIMEELYNNTWL